MLSVLSMEARQIIAWNVRRLRVAADIAQDQLALNAELDRAYVGKLERGETNPTLSTLEKLATALEVHISDLLKEPKPSTAPQSLKGGRKPMQKKHR